MEKVFNGSRTLEDFCEWALEKEHNGMIFIAHNSKGYDEIMILKYCHDHNILPEVIMNGSKVMQLYISRADIKFIDSLDFLPMALSKLPKTFGIDELHKGFFPQLQRTDTQGSLF
uniref:DNA-directed DNA polymerase n=1 Tax=Saccoglossus kowalevskii TaxID=10224 RepID=A0ABM0M304_SACKO|nr:PREDICTED: uncharacterized protein LOC102808859 [Saccoglossus kowalevskii]